MNAAMTIDEVKDANVTIRWHIFSLRAKILIVLITFGIVSLISALILIAFDLSHEATVLVSALSSGILVGVNLVIFNKKVAQNKTQITKNKVIKS